MSKFLRIDDVARITGYTKSTLYSYVFTGVMRPPRKRTGTTMLYTRQEVDSFIRTYKPAAQRQERKRKRN